MSRSSTKVFFGVTWSAGTPATSSMISPRPARISCSVMAIGLLFSFWRTIASFAPVLLWVARPGLGRGSGYRDHLRGVAHARSETDEQGLGAGRDLAPLDHPRQRERDRCRRGIAGGHDV